MKKKESIARDRRVPWGRAGGPETEPRGTRIMGWVVAGEESRQRHQSLRQELAEVPEVRAPHTWVKVPCEQLRAYRCAKKAPCSGQRTAVMG